LAQVHSLGTVLAKALDLGRVLLLQYYEPHTIYTSGAYCEGLPNMDDCFFERLSSCSIDDLDLTEAQDHVRGTDQSDMRILKDVGGEGPGVLLWRYSAELRTIPPAIQLPLVPTDHETRHARKPYLVSTLHFHTTFPHYISVCAGFTVERLDVPSRYHALLAVSGIPRHRWHYWWRGVGAAYTVRPNSRTLAEMQRVREQILPGHHDLSRAISVRSSMQQLSNMQSKSLLDHTGGPLSNATCVHAFLLEQDSDPTQHAAQA